MSSIQGRRTAIYTCGSRMRVAHLLPIRSFSFCFSSSLISETASCTWHSKKQNRTEAKRERKRRRLLEQTQHNEKCIIETFTHTVISHHISSPLPFIIAYRLSHLQMHSLSSSPVASAPAFGLVWLLAWAALWPEAGWLSPILRPIAPTASPWPDRYSFMWKGQRKQEIIEQTKESA